MSLSANQNRGFAFMNMYKCMCIINTFIRQQLTNLETFTNFFHARNPDDVIKERVYNKRQTLINDPPLYLKSWIPLLEALQACCKLYNIGRLLSLYYVMSCHHAIIKSEVWPICHCLGLVHEPMVCAVCLLTFSFLYSYIISYHILLYYILTGFMCFIWGRWFVSTIAHRLSVYTGWAVLQHK